MADNWTEVELRAAVQLYLATSANSTTVQTEIGQSRPAHS